MPSRALIEKAEDILGDMPPWYEQDDIASGIVLALAKELQRVEDFLSTVRFQMFPANADDTYGILGRWEAFFGLPVEPNIPIETRRQILNAQLRKRKASSGQAWELAVTEALGSGDWDYIEGPGAYQLTITYPYQPGAYTSVQVQNLVRAITPAHIQILAAYSQGFLIGISLIGDPL